MNGFKISTFMLLILFFSQAISQYKLTYSDSLMYYGTQMYKNKNLIGAKEKLDSCIALNPVNDECRYYRAKIEFELGNFERAKIMFKNVLALTERDASSWNMLGLSFTNLKQYDSAEFCFKNCISINSRESKYYANWAENQRLRGDIKHAEGLYSTAILLDSKKGEYYANRSEVRKELGQDKEAQKDLEQAITLEPQNPNIIRKVDAQKSDFKSAYLIFGLCLASMLLFGIWFKKRKV